MFLTKNQDDELARTIKSLLNDECNTFKRRLISMLASLSVSDWERLEKEVRTLLEPDKDSYLIG